MRIIHGVLYYLVKQRKIWSEIWGCAVNYLCSLSVLAGWSAVTAFSTLKSEKYLLLLRLSKKHQAKHRKITQVETFLFINKQNFPCTTSEARGPSGNSIFVLVFLTQSHCHGVACCHLAMQFPNYTVHKKNQFLRFKFSKLT